MASRRTCETSCGSRYPRLALRILFTRTSRSEMWHKKQVLIRRQPDPRGTQFSQPTLGSAVRMAYPQLRWITVRLDRQIRSSSSPAPRSPRCQP